MRTRKQEYLSRDNVAVVQGMTLAIAAAMTDIPEEQRFDVLDEVCLLRLWKSQSQNNHP